MIFSLRRGLRAVGDAREKSGTVAIAIAPGVAREHGIVIRSLPVHSRRITVGVVRQVGIPKVVVEFGASHGRLRKESHDGGGHRRNTARWNNVIRNWRAVLIDRWIRGVDRGSRRYAEIADAFCIHRHGAAAQLSGNDARGFLVEKREELVLFDGPAQVPAKLIANVLRLCEALPVGKEIVRVRVTIAKIFIKRAVVFVRAALADHADHRAAAAVFGRIGIGDDLELLQRVHRRTSYLRGQLLHVFRDRVIIHAVQKEVVFELADAMHVESAGTAGTGAAALVRIALPLYAGNQIHQIVPASQQQWILRHVLVVHHGADG